MYSNLTLVHSWLRWAVLGLALFVIVKAVIGLLSKGSFSNGDRKGGLFFMISCDIQLLIGLVLYFVYSPYGFAAFSNEAINPMKDANVRYFAVEHISVMVIAWVLVHLGYARVKKAASDLAKHKTALIFYGIAIVLMLSRIPFASRALLRTE